MVRLLDRIARLSMGAGPAALMIATLGPSDAQAQTLGTFRWQTAPYCNVLTVAITQVGGVYRVDGTDDQCGGGRDQASVVGIAFPNPDGGIGLGLTVVTSPGGMAAHIDAEISLAGLSGLWRGPGSSGGSFAFTPGAPTPGYPRPTPAAAVPPSISLLDDGGLVARKNGAGGLPASGPGTRMMWYPGKAAFRAGTVNADQWDDANIGQYSTAFGLDTRAGYLSTAMGFRSQATGTNSTALGADTYATGLYSTAMGKDAVASDEAATAMGLGTRANGQSSTAMGFHTRASALAATAIGAETKATGVYSAAGGFQSEANGGTALAFGAHSAANGQYSVALGTHATTTASAWGSFVFADASNNTAFTSFAPNEFVVRAAGGVGVYTNATATTGAEMAPGGGSWAALSDVAMKENFRDVAGEAILAKLAAMPIREWNYTSQDPGIRHLGPTAQDFRAAFGLGEYERRITATDADGIALAGVQALEARTRGLAQQAADLERLRAESVDLNARLAALEQRLERR